MGKGPMSDGAIEFRAEDTLDSLAARSASSQAPTARNIVARGKRVSRDAPGSSPQTKFRRLSMGRRSFLGHVYFAPMILVTSISPDERKEFKGDNDPGVSSQFHRGLTPGYSLSPLRREIPGLPKPNATTPGRAAALPGPGLEFANAFSVSKPRARSLKQRARSLFAPPAL
jgi:hypothetical protein